MKSTERQLWKRHLVFGDEKARDQLIEMYRYLAVDAARVECRKGNGLWDEGDLLGVAYVALVTAVDDYSPVAGTIFKTWAHTKMYGYMKHYQRDNAYIERRVWEVFRQYRAARREFGENVSTEEIAKHIGVSHRTLIGHLHKMDEGAPLSLNSDLNDDGFSLTDVLADNSESLFGQTLRAVQSEHLHTAISRLNPREQMLIRMRYFEGKPLTEIYHHIGVSKQTVYNIEGRIRRKLYHFLNKSMFFDGPPTTYERVRKSSLQASS